MQPSTSDMGVLLVISQGHARDRDAEVARRLVELVRHLVEGRDLTEHLHDLVTTLAELVPALEAGILVMDEQGQPQLVACTSESARQAELFQLQNRMGGPCLECLRTGRAVSVTDFENDSRWVPFVQVSRSLGFGQVHALPMHLGGEVVGTVDLFADNRGLTDPDLQVGQALADLATVSIVTQRTAANAEVEAEQLRHALRSRVVIEQAKGRLAEAGSIDVATAFNKLRTYCRAHHLRLHDVAAGIVDGSFRPERVLDPREAESVRSDT